MPRQKTAGQWLVSLTVNLQAWVHIPAWASGAQPTQLFIPFEMVSNCVPGKTWRRKTGNPDVAPALWRLGFSYHRPKGPAGQREGQLPHSYSVCYQLYHYTGVNLSGKMKVWQIPCSFSTEAWWGVNKSYVDCSYQYYKHKLLKDG